MPAAIDLENIHLRFRVRTATRVSLKEYLVGGLFRPSANPPVEVHALRGVTLRVREGERRGVIGYNGAVKSTLLKVIAGVYPPSSGRVAISGNVVPLLGLNAGVNLDFIAEDNIALLLRISGRKPTRAVIDEIWAFTELEERMQRLPLRMFSSGMLMRVLFATATAFPADILLLDEWLSVVDEHFAEKAEQRLQNLVSQAAIVIIASHDQPLLRRTCTSIINLDHGRIASTVTVEQPSTLPFEFREISA